MMQSRGKFPVIFSKKQTSSGTSNLYFILLATDRCTPLSALSVRKECRRLEFLAYLIWNLSTRKLLSLEVRLKGVQPIEVDPWADSFRCGGGFLRLTWVLLVLTSSVRERGSFRIQPIANEGLALASDAIPWRAGTSLVQAISLAFRFNFTNPRTCLANPQMLYEYIINNLYQLNRCELETDQLHTITPHCFCN
jgi:hypothetical protein